MWARYVGGAWFLYGELLLIALLMHAYWEMGTRARAAAIS